jgi:drug/metabolite transporter (DMT)-like permease
MGRAYLAIAVVTVLWAGNFTAGKICTREINPYFIASVRVFLSAVIFYGLLAREERKLAASDWKHFVPLALSGIALNHVCFATGILRTLPSHSAIIHALIPVFVTVMAWVLIKERLGGVALAGMVLAVAGALVVVMKAPQEERDQTLLGDVLTTAGVLAFSFYTVYGRRAIGKMGSLRAVTFAFIFACPVMVPVLAYGLYAQDWGLVTWRGWAALAYMFVAANLICYRLHIFALTRLKAGQVAAFTTLQPAIGIGIAVLAGLDQVTLPLLLGSGLALLGITLVQGRR